MKLKALTVAVLGALTLTGCEEPRADYTNVPTIEDLTRQEAIKQSLTEANKEKEEIRMFLETARKEDPSIIDAYYSIDSNGEKMLNVVRQPNTSQQNNDDDDSNLEVFALAMAGGLAGAALANAMVSHPSYYDHSYRSKTYKSYTLSRKEEKKRRQSYVAMYNNHMVKKNISSVKNNPTKMKALTTKRNAFVSKSSTSRASTVSRGG